MKNNQEVIPRYPFQPTLKIGDFEGPLDLLLHLIRQSKMDIYDIQIEQITQQYFDYLRKMKSHQLEVAGDYFVMAATLMNIKSRMLLPQPEEEMEETNEEVEDPRQELVEQLLEYQRYQKAASHLKDKATFRQAEYTRPAMHVPVEMIAQHVEPGVTLVQLQQAFADVLKRHQLVAPVHETVAAEKISVAQRMEQVFMTIRKAATRFDDLFIGKRTRDELVTTFLAVLELTKHQAIVVHQEELFGPIILVEGSKGEQYRVNKSSED
ncbi:MAG: segregation/condensation protein A [Limosilactobacillus sp.]|jgi:segregation and condensation protein A|uniref:segregation and condensation protein A n=1 Tax=Limosilactobacillus sp. TaxID=2773925 RepID=UPI0025C19AAC|nr:segregation/condensation protein A [Limosilactobacillus sp.]MCI1975022.1 segregation/condensation protein A [Limosilactobacillus sp.]MCI2031602.1 segregation/condensation protein A [Limosilactobacillus sp.]